MPDKWEKKHGLNPNDASDAKLDTDNDGYSNIEEYLNGTDPNQKQTEDLSNNHETLTKSIQE